MTQFASLFQLKKERFQAVEEMMFLGFCAADQTYAIDVFSVREILKIPRIYTLPQVPPFVKGVIDLRGAVLPLMDLKERLALGSVDLKKGRVIVTSMGSNPLGILVDTVVEVFRCEKKDVLPPPEMLHEPHLRFIEGMVRIQDLLYLILAPKMILTPQEFKSLEKMARTSPR